VYISDSTEDGGWAVPIVPSTTGQGIEVDGIGSIKESSKGIGHRLGKLTSEVDSRLEDKLG
jgi:hypothetical protein